MGFSFCKKSRLEIVGPAARLFWCVLCVLWFLKNNHFVVNLLRGLKTTVTVGCFFG